MSIKHGKTSVSWENLLDQLRLEPGSAIYYKCDAAWRIMPRVMPDEQLHILHAGVMEYTIDGVVHPAKAREVVFCPPGVEWSAIRTSTRLVNVTVLHFQATFPGGKRYLDALGFPVVLRPGAETWSALIDIGRELCALYEHRPVSHALRRASLFYNFFDTIFPMRGTSAPVDRDGQRVLDVVEYLRTHLGREVSSASLGRLAHISPNHLSTLFRRYTGMSPIDFLIQLRIQEAQRLLHSPSESIEEVGRQVGYNDPAYFSRLFKKHTGVSPREFRREGRRWT